MPTRSGVARPARKPAPPAAAEGRARRSSSVRSRSASACRTGASYCFVLAGSDPADGVLVTIPPHVGPRR